MSIDTLSIVPGLYRKVILKAFNQLNYSYVFNGLSNIEQGDLKDIEHVYSVNIGKYVVNLKVSDSICIIYCEGFKGLGEVSIPYSIDNLECSVFEVVEYLLNLNKDNLIVNSNNLGSLRTLSNFIVNNEFRLKLNDFVSGDNNTNKDYLFLEYYGDLDLDFIVSYVSDNCTFCLCITNKKFTSDSDVLVDLAYFNSIDLLINYLNSYLLNYSKNGNESNESNDK